MTDHTEKRREDTPVFWSLLAGAWDQGYQAGTGDHYSEASNPYREVEWCRSCHHEPPHHFEDCPGLDAKLDPAADVPLTGPRTGLTFTELEDAWFDANEHAELNLDLDGRPIAPLLAQVERPPAQNPHTVKVREVREEGKDTCWKWTCACGETGYANTSIEADYWGNKHATASERIDELNEKMPAQHPAAG